jgi:hypothetical protein
VSVLSPGKPPCIYVSGLSPGKPPCIYVSGLSMLFLFQQLFTVLRNCFDGITFLFSVFYFNASRSKTAHMIA